MIRISRAVFLLCWAAEQLGAVNLTVRKVCLPAQLPLATFIASDESTSVTLNFLHCERGVMLLLLCGTSVEISNVLSIRSGYNGFSTNGRCDYFDFVFK